MRSYQAIRDSVGSNGSKGDRSRSYKARVRIDVDLDYRRRIVGYKVLKYSYGEDTGGCFVG